MGGLQTKSIDFSQLFLHVLKVDVVKGTNNEDHLLLTASICTSQGKYVVICQMILLHERRISYCWVLSHSMPVLLGLEYTKNIVAIMTDRDSNEMEELEKAITSYQPE